MAHHLQCEESDLGSEVFNARKATKEVLSQWLDVMERQSKMIEDLQGVVDLSKSELIITQQKVVKLQEELLNRKDKQ